VKKCPYCAEDIQDEAVVCRYCGRDLVTGAQTQPVVQVVQQVKKSRAGCWVGLAVLIAILVIFLVFLKACADIAAPGNPASVVSGTKIGPTQKPLATEVKTSFKMGDTVILDDLQLTVSNLADVPGAEYYKPKNGYRFFKFDVLFENKGTGSLYVDNHDFKVVGPDGTQYDYSFEAEQAAGLKGWSNANLLPGTKTTTGTAFEIPATQQGFKLYYDSSGFMQSGLIEFDLGF
jgi:hypothetical protein